MKKCREMNPQIFESNLIKTVYEIVHSDKHLQFKITPEIKRGAILDGMDDAFYHCVLSDDNINGKWFTTKQSVELLTCLSPFVPTQIKVKYLSEDSDTLYFELITSTRVRKPSQLANIDTGHPPFKAVSDK